MGQPGGWDLHASRTRHCKNSCACPSVHQRGQNKKEIETKPPTVLNHFTNKYLTPVAHRSFPFSLHLVLHFTFFLSLLSSLRTSFILQTERTRQSKIATGIFLNDNYLQRCATASSSVSLAFPHGHTPYTSAFLLLPYSPSNNLFPHPACDRLGAFPAFT